MKKRVVIFKLKLSSSVLFDYRGSSSSYVSWRAHRVRLWDGNPLICSGGSNYDSMFWCLWFQTTALQFHLIKLKHLLTSYYFHPLVHSSSHTLLQYFSLQQAAVLFLSCRGTQSTHKYKNKCKYVRNVSTYLQLRELLKTVVMLLGLATVQKQSWQKQTIWINLLYVFNFVFMRASI